MKKPASEPKKCGATTGDLGEGAHRAWGALLRSHAHFVERIERKLSAQGALSPEAYDVLLMLSYAPNHRLRMGELYETATLSRSGLTRLVDRLEKEGWVKREVCPNDRRSFEAVLTASGEAARARSWPLYAQAIAREFGHFFDEKEAHTLADLLERPLGKGESEAQV
ncbi:transcriptional regulator, MarR family [Abditibacterium utsteinense]|uniref:Transcriptional regulator, MarR family n=1 Tax=Abditibacterium utsteinense TaxID=1960156 RepID=A0A2S8SSK7_9BACT|nr:MarR family winged helix-turn-helix transcriptional regulator [Abditibacterium utsteinense]PQV63758.1 transcriptional regulator, MarR family [Abditibacterium utsteinense]